MMAASTKIELKKCQAKVAKGVPGAAAQVPRLLAVVEEREEQLREATVALDAHGVPDAGQRFAMGIMADGIDTLERYKRESGDKDAVTGNYSGEIHAGAILIGQTTASASGPLDRQP